MRIMQFNPFVTPAFAGVTQCEFSEAPLTLFFVQLDGNIVNAIIAPD